VQLIESQVMAVTEGRRPGNDVTALAVIVSGDNEHLTRRFY
jgi:hypothetical protein